MTIRSTPTPTTSTSSSVGDPDVALELDLSSHRPRRWLGAGAVVAVTVVAIVAAATVVTRDSAHMRTVATTALPSSTSASTSSATTSSSTVAEAPQPLPPAPTATPTAARAPVASAPRRVVATTPTPAPPAPPSTAVVSPACGASASAPQVTTGLWVAGWRTPAKRVSDDIPTAVAWAHDADRLAWLAGGNLRAAATRTDAAPGRSGRTLLEGWSVVPRLFWNDQADGVLVAGQRPDGVSGLWEIPIDGSPPRLVRAIEAPPTDLSVGGIFPHRGGRMFLAAIVEGGRAWAINGSGGSRALVDSGAERVIVDRLGENVAVGTASGLLVSAYPAQPAVNVVAAKATPLEWSYTSGHLLLETSDGAAVMRPDGSALRTLSNRSVAATFGSAGSTILLTESRDGTADLVEFTADGERTKVLEQGVWAVTMSPYSQFTWITTSTPTLCLAPDSQSTNRYPLARLDGLSLRASPAFPIGWDSSLDVPLALSLG